MKFVATPTRLPRAAPAPALRMATAAAVPTLGPWQLTGLLEKSAQLAIYRGVPRGESGPGCYVLKVARGQARNNLLSRAMLRRESLVSERISHPHLIATLSSHVDSDFAYLVLPYLEGLTLQYVINALAGDWGRESIAEFGFTNGETCSAIDSRPHLGRPHLGTHHLLPISSALGIARQVAEALAALHAAGWLHGQVHPRHVIVAPQGHATLIDMTLARRLDSAECHVERDTAGLAASSSPESTVAGARLTAAADIYSLGELLFETLTGQSLFSGPNPGQIAARHRRELPPDVRAYRPSASREVGELVRRMLRKEPLRRPSSEEVVRWLVELEIEELAHH